MLQHMEEHNSGLSKGQLGKLQGNSSHFLAKVNSSEPEYTQLGTK